MLDRLKEVLKPIKGKGLNKITREEFEERAGRKIDFSFESSETLNPLYNTDVEEVTNTLKNILTMDEYGSFGSSWDTSNTVDMSELFAKCRSVGLNTVHVVQDGIEKSIPIEEIEGHLTSYPDLLSKSIDDLKNDMSSKVDNVKANLTNKIDDTKNDFNKELESLKNQAIGEGLGLMAGATLEGLADAAVDVAVSTAVEVALEGC